jgi:hypothetical protein
MEYAILGIVLLGFAGIGGLLLRRSPVSSDSELTRRVAEMEGKNKQMYAQMVDLKAQLSQAQKEKADQQRMLAKHEEATERREKEFSQMTMRLEKADQSLQEERARVIREEEARRQRMEADRDRVWADHETNVIAAMTALCKAPHLGFTHYTNLNLPDGFDGSLKPDFMIEFLGQYVIFDAKASKAESLQTYITNAVKDTVKKIRKNDRIATTIFLVVPTQAIHELKTHYYPLDGYSIYVVSPESLGPILSSLKKITTYELAEQLDPQKRENLINLLATMDFQISLQNAASLYLTQSGIDALEQAAAIDPELWDEAQRKKKEMKIPAFTEIKRLVHDLDTQQEAVASLVSPKARIQKKDIQRAKEAIIDRLL